MILKIKILKPFVCRKRIKVNLFVSSEFNTIGQNT